MDDNFKFVFFAGLVNKMTAQGAHHNGKNINDDDANGENPQGLVCTVWNNPVIYIQDIKGSDQSQNIDQKCGQHHVPVNPPGFKHGTPEPMTGCRRTQLIQRFFFQTVFRADKDRVTRIQFFQFVLSEDLFSHTCFRQENFIF